MIIEIDPHNRRWLPDADSDHYLLIRPSGFPSVQFARVSGWGEDLYLVTDADGLLVRPANRRLVQLGIWSFKVRGLNHHMSALAATDPRPGMHMRLLREPGNSNDSNAVAVASMTSVNPVGYLDRLKAAKLAKSGVDPGFLQAVVMRFGPSAPRTGTEDPSPGLLHIVAGSPELIARLFR